jgi:predicted nucleotidyltransferase
MKRTIYITEKQKKKISHLNPDKWYEGKGDYALSSSEGDLGYSHVVGDAGGCEAGGMMCEDAYDSDIHKYIESYLDFLERNNYRINPRPAIELNAEPQDGMNIRTGYYDPDERKVVVFVNGRHIKDILRSFAHEMVHHMQNLQDEHMDWGHGGDLVDDDKLRELEGEAYHVGNILFREWTEELKKIGKINESKKIIKNDKGDVVPEKCDKCGGKVVCQIHGEPVYVCKDCGKYFGTMPFTLKESINWAEKLKSLKARRDPDGIEDWGDLKEATESDVDLSSFKIQNKLNPKIWVNDLMDSRVRLKLMDIAQDFIEFLDVNWVKPEDTIVVGSIANYNWSRYSDIDLHIVIDYSKVDERKKFVENYFQAKKREWNETHDGISIFGYPVELYVQDKDAENASSAVYSIDKNKWIKKPEPTTFTKKDIDSLAIKKKASSIMTDIEDLEKKEEKADGDEYKNRKLYDDSSDLIDDITSKRKTSLSKTKDEMNTDNLVFKVLRRNGYLDKLFNLRDKTYDKMNSL